MKRLICIALATLMLLSATACGNITHDTAITSTASASEVFLTERLGEVPENVILGSAEVAAEYGIDMTDFESDGYILRTVDESTLIFGKTDNGLDRAVRAYVKAVENGTADTLDVTYHEGYRVEGLTIAGYDISEYTVYYSETANENMKFAASELVRLVEKATGVKLPIVVGAAVAPAFELRHSDDPALEDDGYRYEVTENGVVIEGAVARGCMNGVWRFLQWEFGWDQLIYGDSYLNEADHINIPVGTARSETPIFELFKIYNPSNTFKSDRYGPSAAQSSYGPISNACHGLQNNNFMDAPDFNVQPCFTDEELYELCLYNVEQYIIARYDNPNFRAVDISHYDTAEFCLCSTCMSIFKEEGGHAGVVVRFANRLSEELNETYPGLVYQIFAYQGTNEPPKVTVPNELVYVTFCYDRNCSNHKLDGSECTDIIEVNGRDNSDYAEWLRGWCELTPNVDVWFYTLGTGLKSYTVIDNIYDDYRYLEEVGVRGIFLESEDYGAFSVKRVEHQLVSEMNWNHEMTREEYDALVCELLEKEYGDGWEYIIEYLDQLNLAQDLAGCWHCWEWRYDWFMAEKRFNIGFYKERFDYFVELMELAKAGACSANQELMIDRLYASVLYSGCFASYFHAYIAGDTERMEVLAKRYELAMEIAAAFHSKLDQFPTIGSGHFAVHYSTTIEEAAWRDWVDWYTDITGRDVPDDAPEYPEIE